MSEISSSAKPCHVAEPSKHRVKEGTKVHSTQHQRGRRHSVGCGVGRAFAKRHPKAVISFSLSHGGRPDGVLGDRSRMESLSSPDGVD